MSASMVVQFADAPPAGWFILDVMRQDGHRYDWAALMIDVEPEDLKDCFCSFPALFYVHPKDYRPGHRTAHQCWVRIAGKHKNRDAAWTALEDAIATRH